MSNIGHEKLHQSDHDIDTSNKSNKYEPTPQKNVDFLVNNVLGGFSVTRFDYNGAYKSHDLL